jgi:TonB family protein
MYGYLNPTTYPSRRMAHAALLAVALLSGLLTLRAPAQQANADGTTAPKLIHKVDADYTREARDAGISGDVTLALEIGEDGTVRDVRVKQSLDKGLDQNAVAAARQWKFEPGKKDGQPVPVEATVVIRFALK